MDLKEKLAQLAPLGHSIIALDSPITDEATANAWADHIDFVSSRTEQNDAVLIVPFTDIEQATNFAGFARIKSNWRIIAVCYHGATGYEPELSAGIAGHISAEVDPAMPFNDLTLPNLPMVSGDKLLTNTHIEQALHKGVAMVAPNHANKPAIVRLISTYQVNPTTGADDDLMLDINGALVVRYVRRDLRMAVKANPRRKNSKAGRQELRSLFLERCLKMDRAEILENVEASKDELTVTVNPHDKTGAMARVPAHWVRGMHIVDVMLDVY